jgi:phthiodiolone/phenolphthiodiolone dimycocerosates ketoreductase
VTAQAVATLHLMTRGRAILGIGPGERVGNEPYGVDWSKPVARFEEALATIRALWDSKGELVNRDSPFFPCATRCLICHHTRASGQRSG